MKLVTNRPEFYNDICEEIRLFLPREAIVLDCAEERQSVLSLILKKDGAFVCTAVYSFGEAEYAYTHSTPLQTVQI